MNQSNTTTTIAPIFVGFTWSGYVRSSLSIVGLILNTINIGVFLSPKLKDTSYKYMLAKSLVNWSYLAFTLATEFISYCVNCDWSPTFMSKFFTIAVGVYFLSVLSLYRTLIDITISVHTYLILINKNWNKQYTYLLVLVGLFIFAAVFNIQKPFTLTIIQIGPNSFMYVFTQYGLSDLNRILLSVQTLFRIFLAVVLLSIINLANLVLFRRRFKNRTIGTLTSIEPIPTGSFHFST